MRIRWNHRRIAAALVTVALAFASSAQALTIDFEDNFHGAKIILPDGSSKLYPDRETWVFTYTGNRKADVYGEGTNWLSGEGDCQTFVTPFITSIDKVPVASELRYDPFSIEPDGLHITASLFSSAQQQAYNVGGFRRFGSGILVSRFGFSYGRIRITARLPAARGAWPKFFLIPQDQDAPPELDILQGMGWDDHGTSLRTGMRLPPGEEGSFSQWSDVGNDLSLSFHEYGLNWTPQTLTWLIDGKEIMKKPTPPSLDQDMYLVIALAVGGKETFNELKISPLNSIAPARLSAGADLIGKNFPTDLVIKSVSITPPKEKD